MFVMSNIGLSSQLGPKRPLPQLTGFAEEVFTGMLPQSLSMHRKSRLSCHRSHSGDKATHADQTWAKPTDIITQPQSAIQMHSSRRRHDGHMDRYIVHLTAVDWV